MEYEELYHNTTNEEIFELQFNDDVWLKLRWPVIATSNDIEDEDMLYAAIWWEKQIEDYLNCEDNEHFLCEKGIDLIYIQQRNAWVNFVNISNNHTYYGQALTQYDENNYPIKSHVEIREVNNDYDNYITTIIHEFGHVMGLEHNNIEGSIMNPNCFNECYVIDRNLEKISSQL
jgi:hypothetical protein